MKRKGQRIKALEAEVEALHVEVGVLIAEVTRLKTPPWPPSVVPDPWSPSVPSPPWQVGDKVPYPIQIWCDSSNETIASAALEAAAPSANA